jgi:CPA2 family monovalent cation:H+ antiporter-2
VIGYGVAGQRIVPDLIESGQQVVVVEMGQTGVQRAKKDGAIGLLGNAQRRDVLMHAGIMTAQLCVLALPDYRASEQTIHQIRACSNSIPIVARARYSIHADQLSTAGADVVVDEEESVGYRLLRNSLKKLGL